jgi:hypothetical protein
MPPSVQNRPYITPTVVCIAAVEVFSSNLDLHKTASFKDIVGAKFPNPDWT